MSTHERCEKCEPGGRDPDEIEVNADNPSAVIPDILYDKHGGNPVRVNFTTVLCPTGDTEIYIDVSDDQSGLQPERGGGMTGMRTNGDQLFGVVDRFGNPRATLQLHPFNGAPGESVRITVTVDDAPPAAITIAAIAGVPMAYPVEKGDARRFVHLPRTPDKAS